MYKVKKLIYLYTATLQLQGINYFVVTNCFCLNRVYCITPSVTLELFCEYAFVETVVKRLTHESGQEYLFRVLF